MGYIAKNSSNKGILTYKEQTSYDDLLDGLRLSLRGYNIQYCHIELMRTYTLSFRILISLPYYL